MCKYIVFIMVLMSMLSCGQQTPLALYEPKSPQELAIKTVLLAFQEATNTKNHRKIETLIHENASLMIGRERNILSKTAYVELLPQRLAENVSIALGKPRIKVSGDTARVKIYMTIGEYNLLIVYQMQFQKNKWYIKSWAY
jgi:hypothetical protein